MTWLMGVLWYRHSFPVVLVVLDVAAAARYGIDGEWGRVGYWMCAAGITACATWGAMK